MKKNNTKRQHLYKIKLSISSAFFLFVLFFILSANFVQADSNFIFNKNLKVGVLSQDVKELQKFLNSHNYLIAKSGAGSLGSETTYFGTKTKAAVIFFQKANKINPIGIVGPLTRNLINKINNKTLEVNKTPVKDEGKYSIGGSISGITGDIILKNNGGDSIVVGLYDSPNFTFPAKLSNGSSYNVEVILKYLRQKCSIINNIGVIKNSDINDVKIVCSPISLISGTGLINKVIKQSTISGVTVPSTGGTPVVTLSDTKEYRATISWVGNPTVYNANTSYTAIINIIPKYGYTLKGVPQNFFKVSGANTTNDINSGVVTAVFPSASAIQLTISNPTLTKSKIYDENTIATVIPGTLSGVINSDVVTVTADANYDSADVGINKTITVVYTIGGANAGDYAKPLDYIVNDGEITSVKAASPSFTPSSSKIPLTIAKVGDASDTGTDVQISSSTPSSEIYYTTNGTDPTTSSTLYTGAIKLNETKTLKAITVKDNFINSDVNASEYKINQSPSGTFSNPHGTVAVGNKFYIGTRTSPATVTVFNDSNDLTSNFQTVTLTGHSNLDYMVYDSVNDKLYATCYDNDHKVTIIRINPNNITDWSVVYHNLVNDWSAPIVTDGTYVYGVTYNSNPASFFKIRISDWSLFALVNWNDNLGVAPWPNTYYPHAVSLVNYADRKEMYVTTVWDTPTRFAKVNLNGSMSYTSISLNDNYSITDDIVCRYMDETGSLCYAGTDIGYTGYSTEKTGFKIDTRNMTFTKFSIGGDSSYGMFIKDDNLYNLDVNNKIIRYKNFDTSLPEFFSTPSIVPNELLFSSSGKMYITDWQDPNPSKIIEIKFKE